LPWRLPLSSRPWRENTAGVDHVGLGSDFDGATMPLGMEDASKLPKITDALLKKGYSEADIAAKRRPRYSSENVKIT
jgi:microsomal dipeptidase-like Zn-dependent dipeptidase